MRYAGLIFTCLLLFSFVQNDEEVIVWNKNRPLTWNDYKGKPQRRFAAASTVYSLGRKVITENNKPYAQIQAYFYCNDSWKKKEWISESVLRHEQKHFDIVELYCRMMRKDISGMYFRNKWDAELKVDSLYQKYNKEMDVYQDKYDDETNGSMDGDKQRYWEKRINRQLDSLGKYESAMVSLQIR